MSLPTDVSSREDLNYIKLQRNQKRFAPLFLQFIEECELRFAEVAESRSGAENLKARLQQLLALIQANEQHLSSTDDEVKNARGGTSNLNQRFSNIDNFLQQLEQEIIAGRDGEITVLAKNKKQDGRIDALVEELSSAREQESSVVLNLAKNYLNYSLGLLHDLDAKNHFIRNVRDGEQPSDAVTLGQVNSIVSAGGEPSNIDIRQFNKGADVPAGVGYISDGSQIVADIPKVISTDYHAAAGDVILANVTGGGFSVFLPENPTVASTRIVIYDCEGLFNRHPLSVVPFTDQRIMGKTGNLIFRSMHARLELIYYGGSQGWYLSHKSSGLSGTNVANYLAAIREPSVDHVIKIMG